jgi:O-antigen/teichoic acid export membrane protein
VPIRLLAPYNFAQQLSTGIGTVTEQFGKVLLPVATQLGATEQRDRLRELFIVSTRITLAIALAVGLPVALLGGPVLGIWVGHKFSSYGDIVALLAVASVIDLTSYSAAALLQSIERHGPIAWMALTSGVLNLCLSVALVFPLGVRGAALATLIATTAEMTLLVLPYTGRVLEVSAGDFVSQVLLRLAPAGLACSAVLVILSAIVSVTTLPALVLVVAPALIVYAVVYFCFGATANERDAFRSLASTARGRAARRRAARSTSTL